MRYRKLTATGDFSFGASELDLWVNVPEAVSQAVETRLELWLGEWFLDLTEGTPYLDAILGKHSQELADSVIKDRILNTEGVVSIEDYSSSLDTTTRGLKVSLTLNTIYGISELELLVLNNH